jgi:hypothetical protein
VAAEAEGCGGLTGTGRLYSGRQDDSPAAFFYGLPAHIHAAGRDHKAALINLYGVVN